MNLLVGDNGTGKSSLISLIRNLTGKAIPFSREDALKTIFCDADKDSFYGFDFERDNFRTRSDFDSDQMMFQMLSLKKSHGETVREQLKVLKLKDEMKKIIFVLDEPDMSLSLVGLKLLTDYLHMAVDNGNQVIAAVHTPDLMREFKDVMNFNRLNSKKGLWCSYNEYEKECEKRYLKLKEKEEKISVE
jgi:predicted ATPase